MGNSPQPASDRNPGAQSRSRLLPSLTCATRSAVVPAMRPVLALSFGVPLGLVLGLGAFTFVYAKGGSYMTDRAAACANCHIMRDQYEGWLRSSHRPVAVCNDCHTPPGTRRQVRDESEKRVLALVLFHRRRISRADSHYATQPRHHRARLPEMPHGDGRGARTVARGRRAVLVHPLSLVGRPSAMTAAHPGRSL